MMRQNFPKRERLLKPFQFQSVYQQRKTQKSPELWLYCAPNGLYYNRLGISVSSKTCANLVERNRIKRLIRQVYRLHKEKFGAGRDIIVVLKKSPEQITYALFENIMLSLAARL
jgi:ribonuclease P protein component